MQFSDLDVEVLIMQSKPNASHHVWSCSFFVFGQTFSFVWFSVICVTVNSKVNLTLSLTLYLLRVTWASRCCHVVEQHFAGGEMHAGLDSPTSHSHPCLQWWRTSWWWYVSLSPFLSLWQITAWQLLTVSQAGRQAGSHCFVMCFTLPALILC